MALQNFETLNLLEMDAGAHTRITIFKYQRPRPNSQLLKQPLGAIILPLPEQLPADHYSMNVGSTDLGFLGNVTNINEAKSATQVTETIKERLGTKGLGSDLFAGAVGVLAAAPGVADILNSKTGFSPMPIEQTAAALSGLTRNPHTALLFNNVNLRTFQISWKISPRNLNESKKLNFIINAIKRTMHPNLAVGGFALDYPNLVTINFNNDKEGIAQIDYAFIKDFAVDATPNGHVYYRDGYPSIVHMTMSVEEIRIKTTEDFLSSAAISDTPNVSQTNPMGPR